MLFHCSEIRNLVAELESNVLVSSWMMTYPSQVRARMLSALAEATSVGVHQVVAIMAQNLCPSMFKYLAPGFKTQRRQPLSSSSLSTSSATRALLDTRRKVEQLRQQATSCLSPVGEKPFGKKRKGNRVAEQKEGAALSEAEAKRQKKLRASRIYDRFQAVAGKKLRNDFAAQAQASRHYVSKSVNSIALQTLLVGASQPRDCLLKNHS